MNTSAPTPEITPWWVLQSRPRCEKKVRDCLLPHVEDLFLPCRASRRQYASKSIVFQVPLFPGYLFAQFDVTRKSELFQLAPLAGLIPVSDQKTFLDQIEGLKQALENSDRITPCPFITTGKRVRITSGKFKGIEGIVRRRSGKSKLVLSIDILQQSVEVELEADLVALAA